jgi:hypothetical protein
MVERMLSQIQKTIAGTRTEKITLARSTISTGRMFVSITLEQTLQIINNWRENLLADGSPQLEPEI